MLLPWDDLNNLKNDIIDMQYIDKDGKRKFDYAEVEKRITDYLIVAYSLGVDNANDSLKSNVKLDRAEMRDAIYKRIAGKTFDERLSEWADLGDYDAIIRVAETEATRVHNEAGENTANSFAKDSNEDLLKTWRTMEDDKVRDTHEYLDGITIPIEGKFITIDGDSATYPGNFSLPENNVNCRCIVEYTRK